MTMMMQGRAVAAMGPAMGGAEEVLDEVLRRTEAGFLAAGEELAVSVDVLRQLTGQFDRLRVTFGAENGDRLMTLTAGTRAHVDAMRGGLGGLLAGGEALRLAVRGVRVEVGDLDRVVRTIANVSINARIQGNGLIPPRPQVSAFIERLAVMAAEAEAILTQVREAMAGIGAEMVAMEDVTQELREELGQKVLPALGRFAGVAQGVLDRQDAMAATNAGLAGRMEAVNAEVSRLVIGLQSGDATRQRLERVRATLFEARAVPHEAMLLDLVAALAQAAVEDATGEIAQSVKSAEAVRQAATQALAQGREFYIDRARIAAPQPEGQGFGDSVETVRGKLDLMRARADALCARLGTILQHETALRQIGHQVRLSGLNAVLICAKLGSEGRSLRELAQWLRRLTDESDAIVARLQEVLGRTEAQARALAGEGIAALDAALHRFFDDAAALGAVMAGIGEDRAEAARVFDRAGVALPQRLGQAAQHLSRFQLLLHDMAFFDSAVAARRALLADPGAPDAEALAHLDGLRRRYTMQSERDLHDRLVGTPRGAPAAPVAEAASDGLDDILF